MNGICVECGKELDEVVECSECGCFCIECYEKNADKWFIAPEEESINHCFDLCHRCTAQNQ